MMQTGISNSINRILVSLDFDGDSASFIESLVTLAAKLNAELCGLFVEDSSLQQIANLPFSREITFLTAHTRALNSAQIARHLQQQAESLRKMMQEFSRLSNVPCSFRTTKGPRIESVLTESYDFQLVIFLPDKYLSLRPKRYAKLEELINPTVMLYDGSTQAQKSAYIVQSLVEKGDLHQLTILTLNQDDEARARQQFNFAEVKTDYQHIDAYTFANIVTRIRAQKTGLLILPLEDALIQQSRQLAAMLDALTCPLLLVR